MRTQRPAVLSFQAEAGRGPATPPRSAFRVLVRHLLHRFLHHELLASDDETKRVLQIAYAAALPTVVVSLFLFTAYHAMPPLPHPRPFWAQAQDHYFFVMYSFVLMGLATVYEWDLLFPDLLDVYVLSVLPLSARKLFAARVLAVFSFLGIALLGTSGLGIIFFPLLAGLPHPWHHLLAHALAVLASGGFSAISFLALQGALLTLLGEAWFRRLGPLLQGLALMVLLAVLLLTPTVNSNLAGLLTASTPMARWYPPFWFVGMYERALYGANASPLFTALAWRGVVATAFGMLCVVVTYPVAYRRRVRQLIEGSAARAPRAHRGWASKPLHRAWLPLPAHRATFHLACQTVMRLQMHRVMLALYGGLAFALVLANMLVLRVHAGHIRPALLVQGIRAALPITLFITVLALHGVTRAPADRRGAWIFRSIVGRPRVAHLSGVKRWVVLCALVSGTLVTLLLLPFSPASLHTARFWVEQAVLCLGFSVLLTDMYFYSRTSLPFTDGRHSSISDMPLAVFRNFVVFPAAVALLVLLEPGFERSWRHLAELALELGAASFILKRLYAKSLWHLNADVLVADEDVFPQGLGLRDG